MIQDERASAIVPVDVSSSPPLQRKFADALRPAMSARCTVASPAFACHEEVVAQALERGVNCRRA